MDGLVPSSAICAPDRIGGGLYDPTAFDDHCGPHNFALQWLVDVDELQLVPHTKWRQSSINNFLLLDKYVLEHFKMSMALWRTRMHLVQHYLHKYADICHQQN